MVGSGVDAGVTSGGLVKPKDIDYNGTVASAAAGGRAEVTRTQSRPYRDALCANKCEAECRETVRQYITTGMFGHCALATASALLVAVGLSACGNPSVPRIEGTYVDSTGFEQLVVNDEKVIVIRADESTLDAATAAIENDRISVDAGYRFSVGTLDQQRDSVSWSTVPDYVSTEISKVSRYDDMLIIGSTPYFATNSAQGQQARRAAVASIENTASIEPATDDSEQPVLLIPDGEYVANGREVPASLLRVSIDGYDVTEEALSCDGQGDDRSIGTRTAWEFQWTDGVRAGSTEYPYTPEAGSSFFEKEHIVFHKLGSVEAEGAMAAFRGACQG